MYFRRLIRTTHDPSTKMAGTVQQITTYGPTVQRGELRRSAMYPTSTQT